MWKCVRLLSFIYTWKNNGRRTHPPLYGTYLVIWALNMPPRTFSPRSDDEARIKTWKLWFIWLKIQWFTYWAAFMWEIHVISVSTCQWGPTEGIFKTKVVKKSVSMLWFSWNVIFLGKSWTTYMQLITSLFSFWPIKYTDFLFWWLSMVSMVFCLLFQAYQSGDSWLASPPPIEPSITSIISVAIPKFLDVSFAP